MKGDQDFKVLVVFLDLVLRSLFLGLFLILLVEASLIAVLSNLAAQPFPLRPCLLSDRTTTVGFQRPKELFPPHFAMVSAALWKPNRSMQQSKCNFAAANRRTYGACAAGFSARAQEAQRRRHRLVGRSLVARGVEEAVRRARDVHVLDGQAELAATRGQPA